MSLISSSRQLDRSASHAFRIQQSSARREAFVRILLTATLGIGLWRATGMAYGYTARSDEAGGSDSPFLKIMLYSLIPLLVIYFTTESGRVAKYFKNTPLVVVAIAALCVASIFVSLDPAASIRGFTATTLITASALAFRLRYGAAETWRVIGIMAAIAIVLNVLYILAFPQFGVMGGHQAGKVKGLFYHKNLLGQFSTISFFLIMLNERVRYGFTKGGLFKAIASVLCLFLTLASQSSTAVVTLCAGLAVLAWLKFLKPVRGTWLRTSITLAVSVGGGLLIALAYTVVIQMVATSLGKDVTLSGRAGIWAQLVPLIADRPLFGYGFAMFRQPEVMVRFVHLTFVAYSTHSTYLELCLNIGVPGTALLMALILKRLIEKAGIHESTPEVRNVQAKEAIVIVLVLIGAATEAGMMLAPVVLWPLLAIALIKPQGATIGKPQPSGNRTTGLGHSMTPSTRRLMRISATHRRPRHPPAI